MVIDDKELKVQKQAHVNGTLCTLTYHQRLKTFFVCKDTTVIRIESSTYLAASAYDELIKVCLNQPCVTVTIVESSLAEA